MEHKNIRIKDIAKKAGVSEGTVDRVLHNRGKVSQVASEKVKLVLSELNYTPNLLARTLGSKKNYRFAIVIPDPQFDPYWEQSYQGIMQAESELAQFGITLSIDYFFYNLLNKVTFHNAFQNAYHAKPDGVLIAPLYYYSTIPLFKELKESGIPCVLFNTFIKDAYGLSFVGQNSLQSGKLAAELISMGQCSESVFAILHIEEDLNNSIHLTEKEQGFNDYFDTLNLKGTYLTKTFSICAPDQSGFQKQVDEVLQTTNLTGIFVSTSKIYAIARELEKRKLNIRLIGYDLLEENLEYLRKGYISFLIHQNPRRQAKLGIRSLANYLLFDKIPPKLNLFPLEIISRHNIDSYVN